ncbi:MAG: bifunctional (p)ppGpp synthetase/guanosine-3',5'-bis(diphosphate) 3'-pyrophosphohydrolase, partial [Oligoflexales bacterium]|nr:bifunctional (p)ppGpp synthetase/guanosine-3',5'-bis(diphosphate) 3'-pyrophosphohydrolase [Oligoflexales bacterium]
NYDGIKDILGLRIIVDTVDQCYETEDILKQLWDYIPEERDDYIQVPRASGYRAIHNVFKTDNLTFETQILTKDMYQYNEFGPAKHSVYKIMDTEKGSSKNTRVKEFLKDYISSIEKVSYQEPIINTSNKIYTFTPKGDIIELVKGAILLDFAYSIHADIGNKAVGGMINGKNAKLTDELRNGDKVEILVSGHKKKPSEDWIKLVKTSKARTLIRRALRQK